jgi:hypothetical protein
VGGDGATPVIRSQTDYFITAGPRADDTSSNTRERRASMPRVYLFVTVMLLAIALASCDMNAGSQPAYQASEASDKPPTATVAVAKPDADPTRQQVQPNLPQLVGPAEAARIVSAVESWELDSDLKVTVRDGLDLLVSNNAASFQGWDVYYVKPWAVRLNDGSMSTDPNRRLYWAVAKFGTGNGRKQAIINVESNAASTLIMPWGPCNEEADIVMSRIFGGPSYGSEEFTGTRCTLRDGTTAEAFVR